MMREIARREIVTRGRSKAYRISTAILVAISAAFVVGAAVLGGDDDGPDTTTIEIGLTDPIDGFAEAADAITRESVEVELIEVEDDDVQRSLDDGDVEVVISGGDTVIWNDAPDFVIGSLVRDVLTSIAVEERSTELGIDDASLGELLAPIELSTELLDPPSDGDNARTIVATIGIFIMFFGIQMYGSQIALVVVEEKAYRIVEILLALVRPRDLLAGKVIGVGVLAAAQVAIPITGLFLALALSGTADIPASAYATLPLLFVTFLLGFVMYGTMFALVGSLVSRQEDAQQVLLPVFVPIIAGYILALQAVASPESTIATVASVVPFTAPFALPVTTAEGTLGAPLVAVSLALLAMTAAAMIALAARVYEFTLLRSGSRVSFGEALKLARR